MCFSFVYFFYTSEKKRDAISLCLHFSNRKTAGSHILLEASSTKSYNAHQVIDLIIFFFLKMYVVYRASSYRALKRNSFLTSKEKKFHFLWLLYYFLSSLSRFYDLHSFTLNPICRVVYIYIGYRSRLHIDSCLYSILNMKGAMVNACPQQRRKGGPAGCTWLRQFGDH